MTSVRDLAAVRGVLAREGVIFIENGEGPG
jgi:hypothetical protein